MAKWALIAVGGGFGSVLRYALHVGVQRAVGVAFPFGTLLVNVLGCALIGLLAGVVAAGVPLREEVRLALTVGVLGGFTTFSTFGLETFHLANDRQWHWAAANVVLSCGLGLAAVWLGYRLALRYWGLPS